MKMLLAWLSIVVVASAAELNAPEPARAKKTAYIIPIRDDIAPPLVYVVRRGVKEAMSAQADLLVLDMKTNGGRLDTTEEIISILNEFRGDTVTFVNDRAFSAGAFISVATRRIYMAPSGVIGAATPIMMAPGGQVQALPENVEAKQMSAVRALVRRVAEKNGHNVDVVEAMIDRNRELTVDGTVINPKGDILTLTASEAAKAYGNPPKPLLSSGTVDNLDTLLQQLGYGNAKRVEIKPTGAERLGTWINAISPILLMVGVICLYIEFKTPGFGAPGIIGITAFAIYFLGGYIAGFSGFEWMLVFLVGVILLALEFFVFPGTVFLGVIGAALMVGGIVMALIDLYPGIPTTPGVPTLPRFAGPSRDSVERALWTLTLAVVGSGVAVWLASRWLPKTSMYATLISTSASGAATTAAFAQREVEWIGQTGTTVSALRPGGKAQFGDSILDARSQGEMLPKGAPVRIIAFSNGTAVVETIA
jgi:membrane-bound serine protease (ClpP class)